MTSSHKKIILAVVILGIAGALLWLNRSRGGLPARSGFVDVETGEVFTFSLDSVRSFPAKSPKSGSETLLPCVERGGKLFVGEHYRSLVQQLDKDGKCKFVDTSSLAVRRTE